MLARVLETDDVAPVRGVELIERELRASDNARESVRQVNTLDRRAANSVNHPKQAVVNFNVGRIFNEDRRFKVAPRHMVLSLLWNEASNAFSVNLGNTHRRLSAVNAVASNDPPPFDNDNEPWGEAA